MLSYWRYPDLDLSLFVSKGETRIEEWLGTVRQYGTEGLTTRELYDLRQQTNLYTSKEITAILHQTMEDQTLRPPGQKTAVVVDEAVKFGLSRMYAMQAEAQGASSVLQVFFDLDEALRWLGEDVARRVGENADDIFA
jgi:hypothetical protein